MREVVLERAGDSWAGASASVLRATGGRISYRVADTQTSVVDADLADSDQLTVGLLMGWGLAIGQESFSLFWFDEQTKFIALAGRVSRLSFEGRYDPGGLHRVGFHELGMDSCLVETEDAISRVDRRRGITWSYVHEDVTCRVINTSEQYVTLESEWDRSLIAADTGRFIDSEPID